VVGKVRFCLLSLFYSFGAEMNKSKPDPTSFDSDTLEFGTLFDDAEVMTADDVYFLLDKLQASNQNITE
jgi:hypothetical protein